MRQYQNIIENQEPQADGADKAVWYRTTEYKWGIKKQTYQITTQKMAHQWEKPKGKYVVVSFPNPKVQSMVQWSYAVDLFSNIIKHFLGTISPHDRVLVVALGNRDLVADSLGAQALKHVFITANLKKEAPFENKPTIMAFETGVQGWTGIQSHDALLAIVEKLKPDKTIVVDTLCANHYARLGSSFQFNNGGIVPGKGIGQAKKAIDATMSKKVLSIGVPLVIYAKNLVQNVWDDWVKQKTKENDAGERNDLNINPNLDDLVVTPTDIETQVVLCGKMLGFAINQALLGLSFEKQQQWFGWLNI